MAQRLKQLEIGIESFENSGPKPLTLSSVGDDQSTVRIDSGQVVSELTSRERFWEDLGNSCVRNITAGQIVFSLAFHEQSVCAGLENGAIGVWNRTTLQLERTLIGHSGIVGTLLSMDGLLFSASNDHTIRVWDMAAGQCQGVLHGHTSRITSLAANGGRLVSGSWDMSVKLWRTAGVMSPHWRCQCERSLDGQGSRVYAVAAWGDMVAGGSQDGRIRVWEAGTGAVRAVLSGHRKIVYGLVASGRRLISSSLDQTLRVWGMDSWGCLQTVQAYAAGSPQYVRALASGGPVLVGGSSSNPRLQSQQYEVRPPAAPGHPLADTRPPAGAARLLAGKRIPRRGPAAGRL